MKSAVQALARSFGVDVLSLAYSKDYIYTHHCGKWGDHKRRGYSKAEQEWRRGQIKVVGSKDTESK